jgi:hypothetical protein
VDRPGLVAEVAPELADDRGHGEGAEHHAEARVEAVDRLEDAHHRDLHEVVEGLALVGEAPGAVDCKPAMLFDQRVADVSIAAAAVGREARIEAGRRWFVAAVTVPRPDVAENAAGYVCGGRVVHVALSTPSTSTYTH